MIITAISPNQSTLEKIKQFLTEPDSNHPFFRDATSENLHKIMTITGGIDHVAAVAEQEHPDLLLVESAIDQAHELQVLERVTARFPRLGVIMLCPTQSPDKLLEAMRVGVREALPTPPSRESLLNAVERFQQRIRQATAPLGVGRILAFVPCKGGSGATFLATNLAYTLATQENKRVALIDFNLQLGDASLFLSNNKATTSIADVTRQIHRLDGSFLASSMLSVLPNLHILPAPDEPEKATEIKPEHVNPLLQVAVNNYDFVILDIGRRMDAVSIRALDKAETIFPVLQQSLPFIRDAKRLIAALHSLGYRDDKLQIIVNRFEKDSEITLDDIEKTLRIPIYKSIPNNFSVVDQSVNHGIPVSKLAPRSPVTKALQDIASEMNPSEAQSETRWFKNLFAFSH